MFLIPSGIIVVNADLTESVQSALQKQLYITDVYDGYEFDQLVLADPSIVATAKAGNRRLLVIRPLTELQNRAEADLVLFVAHGMVIVETNKFGPPSQTYRVAELTWGKLGVRIT